MVDNKQRAIRKAIAPAFFLLGSLLVLALGVVSNQRDRDRIALETRITAEQVKLRLESCVNARTNLVRSVASFPWKNPDQIADEWIEHVNVLTPLYSGVQAMNFIDPQWNIRLVYPVDTNQSALNANLRQNSNPSVPQAMGAAEASGRLTRTNIIELLQSGKGFAVYQQIRSINGEPLGFANGVFRVTDLLQSCLSEERLRDRFSFRLYDAQMLFFQQPVTPGPMETAFLVSLEVDVLGRPWRLAFAPSPDYLAATRNPLGELWIALGLLFVTVLAILIRSLLIKQDTLEINEDNYRLLVENQTDMVVKVDPQGRFLYASPRYCKTFGKSTDQLLGVQFMPLVHEADREVTKRSLQSLQHRPYTSYLEHRAMTTEGWRWIAWSNAAVLDNNEQIEAITAVGRDVTDIKNLEARIAHSQKMRALGEMAGGITHDFNNLLQVMLGSIEVLIARIKGDRESREQLEQLRQVVDSATVLTRKLSTLSRQDITAQEVFDLNTFANQLRTLLQRTLPASINLTLEQSDHPLQIRADRTLLEQVVLNICFNARDAVGDTGNIHMAIGQVTLDDAGVGPMPEVEPGDYACISVTDNGCGMNSELIERIFDPFFTTKKTGTGTGLGLANSYSIIKQHKGMITVESTPGKGSCFTVYLPLSATGGSPVRNDVGIEKHQGA